MYRSFVRLVRRSRFDIRSRGRVSLPGIRTMLAATAAASAVAVAAVCRAQAVPASPQSSPAGRSQTKPARPAEDPEVKLGRENAAENDKQVKLSKDPALLARVNRIGAEIAAVADSIPIPATYGSSQLKQFHYTFKVVEDPDPNAYSLPGGFVYVNTGLLSYVHSDDELAGVLAHEIGHIEHHHMMKLLHEQNKIENVLLPLLAVIMVAGRPNWQDSDKLLITSQLYELARVNAWTVKAEEDADRTAILLLTHTHYNPAGLYSFMLRYAADERTHGAADMGIFRTHPPSAQRAAAAKTLLEQLHVPIRLADVDPMLRATVVSRPDPAGGPALAEVTLRGVVLCSRTASGDESAVQRAQRVADHLNAGADTDLEPFEVRVSADGHAVLLRGFPVEDQADAAAQNRTVQQLAAELSSALVLMQQTIQMQTGD